MLRVPSVLPRCVAQETTCPLFSSISQQAFVPAFYPRQVAAKPLFACRTNAKKEKMKRNRENMRKFKTGGRRGVSRRKLMKKGQASKARQEEAEFIAKCFTSVPLTEEGSQE